MSLETPAIPLPANGHAMPADWQSVPVDTLQRMELGYQEIQRRDAQAEQRAWRKDALARRLALVIVALLGVVIWLALSRSQVRAFVQLVQVSDQGALVQLGVPQSLYDYQPDDGVYMNMLAQWVRWTRWRGEDANMMRAQWAWAYRHSCGIAHKGLSATEEKEKPFKLGDKRVSVEIKSVTKIAATEGYQVLWEESVSDKKMPVVKTQTWTGTFTTGRKALASMEDILENRLGVCVAAYELSPQP
jgi:type IV secretory pathway TrbF-like protein